VIGQQGLIDELTAVGL